MESLRGSGERSHRYTSAHQGYHCDEGKMRKKPKDPGSQAGRFRSPTRCSTFRSNRDYEKCITASQHICTRRLPPLPKHNFS